MEGGPQTQPVYLARKSYRQRRLRDAARALPIAGAILCLLPLLSMEPRTGTTGLYLLGVWVLLIILAASIAARLHDAPQEDTEAADTPSNI